MQPVGPLRVAATEIVLQVVLMGHEENGHASGHDRRTTTVAVMTGHRIVAGSDARLRIATWRGDPGTAHLSPGRSRPTRAAVDVALQVLAGGTYRAAFTTALAPIEQRPFIDAGFVVHERLHLLVRSLDALPQPASAPIDLRRGHRGDHQHVLDVDAAAFPAFWQLDDPGLQDALAATPTSRLRLAIGRDPHSPISGYAITGRAGPRGYLQRLAVDPSAQGAGIGSVLVLDGLRWLRRWGAHEVLVNTQEGNTAAVRLYERLGFRLQPNGLAVLHRAVDRPVS